MLLLHSEQLRPSTVDSLTLVPINQGEQGAVPTPSRTLQVCDTLQCVRDLRSVATGTCRLTLS